MNKLKKDKRNKRLPKYTIPADIDSFTDPSIKRAMMEYALNITGKKGFNEKIIAFAIVCLSARARVMLIENLHDEDKGENEDGYIKNDFYDDAIDYIGEPVDLSRTITRYMNRRLCGFTLQKTGKAIYSLLEEEYRKISKGKGSLETKLTELGEVFNLSQNDLTILKLLYLAYSIDNYTFTELFNEIYYNEFVKLAGTATGLTQGEVRKSLNKSSMLINCGIIESIDHTGRNFISLDDTISEYLTGLSGKNLVSKFVKLEKGKTLKPEDYSIKPEDTSLITDILKSGPCNILLYGTPGTGKSEYAKTIAAETGERVYSVRYGESETSNSRNSTNRIVALRVAINTVSQKGGILIADEADFLLNTKSFFFNTESPEKGWLNDLLDNSKARIIWITNKTGSMEESTLRRFSYSLKFESFTEEQRISVWNNLLRRNPLKKHIPAQLVEELSRKYEVNAGSIASSINAIKQIEGYRDLEPGEIKPLLEKLLEKHSLLLSSNVKKKNRLNDLTGKYDLSLVNADMNMEITVNAVKKFTTAKETGLETEGINLLLWGESGTGKTEFAKYLATETGKDLIIKRASDLMNMYVGNTEKYIAAAFKEAEDKNAILFIDEADTFLGSRERAKQSWEVSHINEFLVQMENFNGVLICCTNLLDIFDTAAMRRFNWKIRFSPLLPEKRYSLYSKYFGDDNFCIITSKHKKKIAAIENLTPGHAKAVSRRISYMEGKAADHDTIIDELEKEASYMKLMKDKRVGFN